jgi:outer membrane protein assembly factor BamB
MLSTNSYFKRLERAVRKYSLGLKLVCITAILLGFLGCQNKPPEIQGKPIGPTDGQINVVDTFYVTATDPEGQDIHYRFDWGDGNILRWTALKPSGSTASDTHTFTTEGEKQIRAQAKDTEGKLSEWSLPKIFFATRDETSIRRRFVEEEDEDSASFVSTPAIADDGTIYVGCSFGHFHAIDSAGIPKAKFIDPEESEFVSSPAIGPDGTIYVSVEDSLYAFNTNLMIRWRFPTGGEVLSSPAIGSDGTVYVLSDDGKLYAISSQGQELWRALIADGGYSSPAIGADGSIYVGGDGEFFYCIRNNGTEKWNFNAGSPINTSPALSSDGKIYFGTEDGVVFCLDSMGTEVWHFPVGASVSSPVLDNDGNIYFSTDGGALICLNPYGSEKWTFSTAGSGASTPAVRQDGTVYFRVGYSIDDTLYAVNENGARRWAVSIGSTDVDEPIPSPTIASDGTVFISGGNALYGFVGKSGGPASSSWPMFRHDTKHTGRVTQ